MKEVRYVNVTLVWRIGKGLLLFESDTERREEKTEFATY